MSRYLFNAPFTRRYFPEQDGRAVQLPDIAPTIYIFGEVQPSLTDAISGTGATQTIDTWEQNENAPYEFAYTVGAIADPDPDGPIWCRTFWEAIKVKTLESGTPITLVRSFELERLGLGDSYPVVRAIDVTNAYPAITSYLSEDQIGELITLALDEIKLSLEAKNLDWAGLRRRDRLFLAVAYKAIELATLSQIRDPNDKHAFRYRVFKEKSEQVLSMVNFMPQDANRDGMPESAEKAGNSSEIIVA